MLRKVQCKKYVCSLAKHATCTIWAQNRKIFGNVDLHLKQMLINELMKECRS